MNEESSADAFVLGVEPSSFVGVSFAGLRMPIRQRDTKEKQ